MLRLLLMRRLAGWGCHGVTDAPGASPSRRVGGSLVVGEKRRKEEKAEGRRGERGSPWSSRARTLSLRSAVGGRRRGAQRSSVGELGRKRGAMRGQWCSSSRRINGAVVRLAEGKRALGHEEVLDGREHKAMARRPNRGGGDDLAGSGLEADGLAEGRDPWATRRRAPGGRDGSRCGADDVRGAQLAGRRDAAGDCSIATGSVVSRAGQAGAARGRKEQGQEQEQEQKQQLSQTASRSRGGGR